jgi:hypothetical protein
MAVGDFTEEANTTRKQPIAANAIADAPKKVPAGAKYYRCTRKRCPPVLNTIGAPCFGHAGDAQILPGQQKSSAPGTRFE